MRFKEALPMELIDDDFEDADVPEQAVRGLNEAQKVAMMNHAVLFVRDGKLIRLEKGVETVLKDMPPRIKVNKKVFVKKS
jgi:uncharacterized membrane protein